MTAVVLQGRPRTPLTASLPRLESLHSRYTGVVRELHELLLAPDDPPLAKVVAATAADVEGPSESSSGGYAVEPLRARAAALGEAIERYAGACVPVDELEVACARDLGDAAVDPARFALFAPEQHARPGFPFVPFTRAAVVRWTRGFRLTDAAPAFLPAQLVYLSWGRLAPGELPIGYATSSGLACGPTLEEAVLGGLLELVERDGFMLAWTNVLSLPLLDWSKDVRLRAFEERVIRPTNARCALVDLSVFLDVPVALAVVEGDGELEPAVAVGAGAAATVDEAVGKAVAEAYAVRAWGRELLQGGSAAPDVDDIVTFRDHIAFYAHADHAASAEFLTASDAVRHAADVPELPAGTPLAQIRAVCELLSAQGVTAYAVDVTPVDVAAAGLRVAKVVAPELCPLDVRHDARFLGGDRLYRLPHALGLRAAPVTWRDVNPAPHPFP